MNDSKIKKEGENSIENQEKIEIEAPLEKAESREMSEDLTPEKLQEIKEQIEHVDLDDHLKIQAQKQAKDIGLLEDDQKIKKLLDTAKKKGVVYAVAIAKEMNDPYLLDTLHDSLARDGHYKDFKQ